MADLKNSEKKASNLSVELDRNNEELKEVKVSASENIPDDDTTTVADDDTTTVADEDTTAIGAYFRGLAMAIRNKIMLKKALITKGIRDLGAARPLHFASEGAVASNNLIPRWTYYGAWGISGLAIGADITAKSWDADEEKKWHTAAYWTAFHVPASLVVPAYVIHQVVDGAEKFAKTSAFFKKKNLPPKVRTIFPVACAVLAIVPVVPVVDLFFETVMEPTLGTYLGLTFHHHKDLELEKHKLE
mmetsp:Transcript_47377/g.92420  ORF Transcript_47377/g.92420 Transcript_47377/m.92420 type:complete len:245 (+) Transcript_47377:47-781(+)